MGGKNASLGEMIQELQPKGIDVPDGFVVTTEGFKSFMDHNKLRDKVNGMLAKLDHENVEELHNTGSAIREMVKKGEWPESLVSEIKEKY